MSAIHVADTGLLVASRQPTNPKYRAVRSFAEWNDITFVLPEKIYEELNVDDIERPTIETVIEEGWADIAEPIDYTNAFVSCRSRWTECVSISRT